MGGKLRWNVCSETGSRGRIEREPRAAEEGSRSEPWAAEEGSRSKSQAAEERSESQPWAAEEGSESQPCHPPAFRLVLEIWKVLLFLGLTAEEACTCGILT